MLSKVPQNTLTQNTPSPKKLDLGTSDLSSHRIPLLIEDFVSRKGCNAMYVEDVEHTPAVSFEDTV